MIQKYNILLLFIICLISCQDNKFELIYKQDELTISNCKNIDFVKWALLKEAGLEIKQDIQIIITDYFGGVPVQINVFPIYYEVEINENQYNEYINKILNSDDAESWGFLENNDELSFRRITKLDLCCVIDKNKIQFGFGKIEGIRP